MDPNPFKKGDNRWPDSPCGVFIAGFLLVIVGLCSLGAWLI